LSAAHARAHGKKKRATRGFCSVCEPFQSIWNLGLAGVFPLQKRRTDMGRYLLLWLLGIPIPILVLIWLFGGLH
jgi:hypothetical protein